MLISLLCALLAACSCGARNSLEELRREPILEPPPGATELLRTEREPRDCLLLCLDREEGRIEVVYASSMTASEARRWYISMHSETYGLAAQGSGRDQLTPLVVHNAGRGLNGRVYVGTAAANPMEVSIGDQARLAPAPGGSASYIIVRIGFEQFE